MHPELHHFLARLIGVMLFTLAPVVFTAFTTLPLALNRHPGEAMVADASAPPRHMT